MTDDEIREEWRRINRLYIRSETAYQGPNRLGIRLALAAADDLEALGVTETEIDRLFPTTPEPSL